MKRQRYEDHPEPSPRGPLLGCVFFRSFLSVNVRQYLMETEHFPPGVKSVARPCGTGTVPGSGAGCPHLTGSTRDPRPHTDTSKAPGSSRATSSLPDAVGKQASRSSRPGAGRHDREN